MLQPMPMHGYHYPALCLPVLPGLGMPQVFQPIRQPILPASDAPIPTSGPICVVFGRSATAQIIYPPLHSIGLYRVLF